MMISIYTSRHFDTSARTTVSYWTVEGGRVDLAHIRWWPHGPMSSRDAVLEVCRQVTARLAPKERPSQGWEDEPLPGL